MEHARRDLINKICVDGMSDVVFKAMVIVCILMGTSIHVFTYAAFALMLLYFLIAGNESCINCMFFLLPFANIFKANPASSSFFSYLTIILALRLIATKKSIEKRFVLVWMVLFAVQVVGCRGQVALLIKQATNLLLIYGFFHNYQSGAKRITLNLAMGMLISCVVANMTAFFPGISEYMRIVRAYEVSTDIYRFTGLFSDPNYLSKTLIVLCVSLFVLIQQNRIGPIYWVVIILFLVFGVQTISKSFFLMLLVMVSLFTGIAIRQRHHGLLLMVLLSCTVVGGLYLSGKLTFFNYIAKRFETGDVTTGRIAIWKDYIGIMISNPLNLLSGFGIGNSLKYMAHNTYLDFLYYYGILGSGVLLLGLYYAVNKKVRCTNIMNWAPMICVLIMDFFLSSLLTYDFAFNLILILSFVLETTELKAEKQGVEEYHDHSNRSVL